MGLQEMVSKAGVAMAVAAFGVTTALSLSVGVDPLYTVLRAIAASLAVLWAARWTAGILNLS